MEHEAFANWFNIEVRSNPQLISTALFHLENLPAHSEQDIILNGAEYSLYINADEVMAKANNLAIENQDELEDGFLLLRSRKHRILRNGRFRSLFAILFSVHPPVIPT